MLPGICVAFPINTHSGPNWPLLKFPGRRQRDTPVTDAKGIVEIIMLLPGRQAARLRRQAAELLVRYLGGDLGIIDEVCAIRGFQEQLAVQRPEDPRRAFGLEVEASSGSIGGTGEQMARVCAGIVAHALPCVSRFCNFVWFQMRPVGFV